MIVLDVWLSLSKYILLLECPDRLLTRKISFSISIIDVSRPSSEVAQTRTS